MIETYFDEICRIFFSLFFFLNLSRRMGDDVPRLILLDLRESLVIRYKTDIALAEFVIDSSSGGEEYKSSRGFREYTRTTS